MVAEKKIKTKISDFSFEVKELSENGSFSGYGSVFGNTDYGGDIVASGAFDQSLKTLQAKNRLLPILWQHNQTQPIGVYNEIKEDNYGLYVEGRLLINEVQQASEAYALMKAKAISGLSIGYYSRNDITDKETNVRTLLEVDLFEISLVTFPMNDDARVEAVKRTIHDGTLPSLPEFEAILREMGFSKKHAAAIASRGLKGLLRSESADPMLRSESVEMANLLKSFKLPTS